VKFDLPSREQQVELFRMLSPKEVAEDVDFGALAEDGISGGDIRNVAYNAAALALKNGRKAPSQQDFLESKELLKAHKKAISKRKEEKPVNGRQYG
jgi:ATP-dependent 26S proteasome regulatory subunit